MSLIYLSVSKTGTRLNILQHPGGYIVLLAILVINFNLQQVRVMLEINTTEQMQNVAK